MKTKIGYFASIMMNKPMDALDQAVKAENVGFDSVWVEDHFHPTYHTNAQSGYAWCWMASALQATKRVSIGTAVTCPTMRYNPTIVAHAFATMAQMYPGRVMAGIGAGEALSDAVCTGSWPTYADRQGMLTEAVQIIAKLWKDKDPVSFHGKYYCVDNAFLYTRPDAAVPIYYSGIGPKSSRLAGIYGDHLMTIPTPIEVLKNYTIPAFEAGAREAGKDPKKMERTLCALYSIDADYDKAVDSTRWSAGSSFPFWMKYKVVDPRELEEYGNRLTHDALANSSTNLIATGPEDLIKQILKFKAAGITHFCLGNSSPDLDYGIRVFEDIIPHVRD